ncbi:hypothetical protein F443_04372 [Phytophthora nicotianae P1569]|uniref:Uncharacterized protein n=1 Tax=Phytophthora nicotianae P1569 TaxID=1317065 RepID=V9FNZ2_PHYNI|nr:hypothetical protein F443_04372 [Phytophthora nicotianae P1569]
MDHRGYLVVVVRISDRARAFHLVAVFIVLQENQLVFETVLLAVFYYVTTRDLQRFWTPTGFAATNNPAEAFNARVKRDYTLRRRLKKDTLLRVLHDRCHDVSASMRQFSFDVAIPQTFTRL